MATNFYVNKLLTEEQLLRLGSLPKECATREEFMEKVDALLDYQYDYKTEDSNHHMHLGRRENGGGFVFCGTLEDHIDIRNDFKEHLREFLDGWQIVGADNTLWNFDSFWKMATEKPEKPIGLEPDRKIINGHVFAMWKSYWQ